MMVLLRSVDHSLGVYLGHERGKQGDHVLVRLREPRRQYAGNLPHYHERNVRLTLTELCKLLPVRHEKRRVHLTDHSGGPLVVEKQPDLAEEDVLVCAEDDDRVLLVLEGILKYPDAPALYDKELVALLSLTYDDIPLPRIALDEELLYLPQDLHIFLEILEKDDVFEYREIIVHGPHSPLSPGLHSSPR